MLLYVFQSNKKICIPKKKKKRISTDTCYNIDEPWIHYIKWKKSITKDYTIYDSIHMQCTKQKNLYKQKVDSGLPKARGEG